MARLFIFLALINVALLGVTAAAGYAIGSPESLGWHTLLGISTALVSVLVQSVAFTYFLGTGRWVQEATVAHELDMGYYRRSRVLKRRATFIVVGAVGAISVVAWLGGATAAGWRMPPHLHEAAAWALGSLYVGLCAWEGRLIRANLDMLDKLVAAVNRAQAGRGA